MLLRKCEIKRHFIYLPHLTSASALAGETLKCKNCITCCITALPDFNQLLV